MQYIRCLITAFCVILITFRNVYAHEERTIPPQILYQLLIAELSLQRSNPTLAWQLYSTLAKSTEDPGIAERATKIGLSLGELNSTLESAKIWVSKDPNNLEGHLILSVIFTLETQLEEAQKELILAIQLEPRNLDTVVTYYRQFEGKEKILAKAVLEQVAKHLPKNYLAQIILADLAFSKGDFKKASDYIQPILALKEYPEEAALLQIYLLREANRLDLVATFIEKRLKEKPDLDQLRVEYFCLLIEQEKPKLALKQLHLLLKKQNLSPSLRVELGRQAMEMGWYTEAKQALRTAAHSRDHLDIAAYFLGRVFELDKKPDDAITWFKQVEPGPFHVVAHIRAALLLNTAGDHDGAIVLLNSTSPADIIEQKQLYLTASEVLFTAHRYTDGSELMNEALDLFGEDLDILYARSLHAEANHDFEHAELDLVRILKADPKHVEALNALGYLLTNHTKRYNEALNLLNKAHELDPENPIVMDSMGWLYLQQGDMHSSLKWLQEAFKRYPDSEIAAHLGEALWHHGDKTNAESIWTQALKQNPEHPALLETINRLKASPQSQQ